MWNRELFALALIISQFRCYATRDKMLKKSFFLEYRSGDVVEYNFDPKNEMAFLICNAKICNATIANYHQDVPEYRLTCIVKMTIKSGRSEKIPINADYRKPKIFADKKLIIVWLATTENGKYLNVKLVDMRNCEAKDDKFLLEVGAPSLIFDYWKESYVKDLVSLAIFEKNFEVIYPSNRCDASTGDDRLGRLNFDKRNLFCRISYDQHLNRIHGPGLFFPQIAYKRTVSSITNFDNTYSWYVITADSPVGNEDFFLGYQNNSFVNWKDNYIPVSNDMQKMCDNYASTKCWWTRAIGWRLFNRISEFVKISPSYQVIGTNIRKYNLQGQDYLSSSLSDIFYLPNGNIMLVILSSSFERDGDAKRREIDIFRSVILFNNGRILRRDEIVKFPRKYLLQKEDSFLYKNNFDFVLKSDVLPAKFGGKSSEFRAYKNITVCSKKIRFL